MFFTSFGLSMLLSFFFFNDTATTEIYTLSLHDALPIFIASNSSCVRCSVSPVRLASVISSATHTVPLSLFTGSRSEEHTSELQSPCNLVCRLLLEKKKQYFTVSDVAVLLKCATLLTLVR